MAALDVPAVRSFTPVLAKLYQPLEPWAYALLRIGTAAILMPHGWQKLAGTAPVAGGRFVTPWLLPADWGMGFGALELFGGALLALGLLTRPVALLLMLELAWVTFAVPRDLAWWMKGATEHYSLTICVVCLAFVLRGGGRYSLDRLIGREF